MVKFTAKNFASRHPFEKRFETFRSAFDQNVSAFVEHGRHDSDDISVPAVVFYDLVAQA